MHVNPRKHRLSHDFRKAMACAWINSEKYRSEEFEVQSEIPAPIRKENWTCLHIAGCNNDTRHLIKRMNQHHNCHNL